MRKIVSHTERVVDKGHSAPDEPSNRHRLKLVTTRSQDTIYQESDEKEFNRSPSHADSEFPSIDRVFAKWKPSEPDPLGLHLVHDHPEPTGDIVFVHGLGGTASKTWSWERNIHNFWPVWLADEDEFTNHRIFTYGYNSNFMGSGTNLNIIDFAKDLLNQLLVHRHGFKEEKKRFGQRQIIFVAHSMGGLVVKKTYVLGKHDERYAHIISKTRGIMFLATPHRGAQYAKILNSILSCSLLGAPPKAYIDDLDLHSRAIQDVNEQFRTSCDEISLVSLYETSKTSFGIKKSIIVEKESATLGYPQELSSPLNADHHSICKFKNRDDTNYMIVKGMLKLWASPIYDRPMQSKWTFVTLIATYISTLVSIKCCEIYYLRRRADPASRAVAVIIHSTG